MTNPTLDLLPCPFCGELPRMYGSQIMVDGECPESLACDNEDCDVMPSTEYLPVTDTIAAWNTRTPTPAPNTGAVKVKKLEWENSALFFKCDWLTVRLAETPVGQYAVKQSDSGYFRVSVNAQFLYGNHPDIKSAKDAAQADYDTRIMSAIETTPDPRDAVIARLVEALEMWPPSSKPQMTDAEYRAAVDTWWRNWSRAALSAAKEVM